MPRRTSARRGWPGSDAAMPRLTLVRHGRAARGWEATDPSLDGVGRAQASELAELLGVRPVMPVVTSPFRRCPETAAPLGTRWGVKPVIEPAVGELPSPAGFSLAERAAWHRTV